ncbi:MAG: hypothetical protein SGJ13_11005 [Actinomycetota bacterium]|nr:hypothetical protein [Actinomycetota bacterium]
MLAVAVAAGCSGDDNGEDNVTRPPPATAQEGLADMKALFRDLAELVGTVAHENVGSSASFCEPPLEDLVYFGWGLRVEVTSAPTGAEALHTIEQELEARGLSFTRDARSDEVEDIRGGDGLMGMRIRGSKTTTEISIVGQSACGPGEEYEQPTVP